MGLVLIPETASFKAGGGGPSEKLAFKELFVRSEMGHSTPPLPRTGNPGATRDETMGRNLKKKRSGCLSERRCSVERRLRHFRPCALLLHVAFAEKKKKMASQGAGKA